MKYVKTNARYRMFSLNKIISTYTDDIRQQIIKKRPTLLLSQIRTIDRGIIEQLERAGIYDTDDLLSANTELIDYLNMDDTRFQSLIQQVDHVVAEQSILPKYLLPIPNNYALISTISTKEVNELGLFWRGMEVTFQHPRNDYWNPIKQTIDKLLVKMNQPELIGRITLSNTPHWLEDVTPVSTYVSNIALDTSLVEMALKWGLDYQRIQHEEKIIQDLLAMTYIFELARSVSD